MDSAAGAAGVEDDGVGLGSAVGGGLAAGRGGREGDAAVGGDAGHEEEDEGDEEEGDGDDKDDAAEAVDLVGEWLLASPLHPVLIGRRGLALALEEFGSGQRSVADLSVVDRSLQGLRFLYRLQLRQEEREEEEEYAEMGKMNKRRRRGTYIYKRRIAC